MPVLAVLAMEIAADTSQRIGQGSWQVVEEGFFLDGIYCFRAYPAVGRSIQYTSLVQPYTANPVLAILDGATVVAECALNRVVFKFLVQVCFVHTNSECT